MPYTVEDLMQVEQAIRDLSAGKKYASVTIGDTTVRFSKMLLDDLLKLRNIIRRELYGVKPIVAITSKGL